MLCRTGETQLQVVEHLNKMTAGNELRRGPPCTICASQIRDTKKVALFPTGSFSGVGVSTPVVVQGKVVSFMDIYMCEWSNPY